MADDRIVISSEPSITTDDIARRSFPVAFRGYDQDQVRRYLRRVADELNAVRDREQEVRRALEEARGQLAHPQLDEATLTAALGEETTRILLSAREAAADLRAKAEERVARMLQDADEHSARLRLEAENILAERVEEADRAAATIRQAAEADARAMVEQQHAELEAIRARGREMVAEAQAVRERVLNDLGRRRRAAQIQIEQLLAGRDRLLDTYRNVRRSADEVTEELGRAEDEARLAAEAAATRAAAAPAETADLEAMIPPAPAAPDPAHDPSASWAPAPPPTQPPTPAPAPAAAPAPSPSPSPPAEPDDALMPSPRLSDPPVVAEPDLPRPSLVRLQPMDEEEGVRIIGPAQSAAPPAGEPAPAAAPTQAPAPAVPEDGGNSVEDLFARLRAERMAAVSRAEEVLATEAAPAAAHTPAEEALPPASASVETEPPSEAPPADDTERTAPAEGDADKLLLERRTECLDPVAIDLGRRLKRVLQDEQNEILDRLRNARGRAKAEDALPSAADQIGRYRDAAIESLVDATRAGASFLGAPPAADLSAREWAQSLGEDLVAGLRDRVARSFEEGAEGDAADGLGAVYRQWKTERIDRVARDHALAAFNEGVFASAADGTVLRWVFGDDGPCPDCDDNVLAGPTIKGEQYPTGQLHPPAHGGCGCVLTLAADGAR